MTLDTAWTTMFCGADKTQDELVCSFYVTRNRGFKGNGIGVLPLLYLFLVVLQAKMHNLSPERK